MVVDITELLGSIGAIQVQEASDRTKLSVILHESYIEYLLGKDIGQIIADIQALCVGVIISYSISGTTLNIHVSRA